MKLSLLIFLQPFLSEPVFVENANEETMFLWGSFFTILGFIAILARLICVRCDW
jgi:hypothetical protein